MQGHKLGPKIERNMESKIVQLPFNTITKMQQFKNISLKCSDQQLMTQVIKHRNFNISDAHTHTHTHT